VISLAAAFCTCRMSLSVSACLGGAVGSVAKKERKKERRKKKLVYNEGEH